VLLVRHPGGSDEDHKIKSAARLADVPSEIRAWHVSNIDQKRYR
jgi:hypothetical protein